MNKYKDALEKQGFIKTEYNRGFTYEHVKFDDIYISKSDLSVYGEKIMPQHLFALAEIIKTLKEVSK